ncbi:MAG TPA: serine hydrolase [Vicinamibacteria bacterium]|nr:serine hydrolase [Vicinamibacteria bacterium]
MPVPRALPLAFLVCAAHLATAAPPAPGRAAAVPPLAAPTSAGMSAEVLARIDGVVAESIAARDTPGAVVLVGRKGKVVFRKAYGMRALVPGPERMTADTVFDLASLTKIVATATSVMTLVEAGRLRLEDPVARYLPDFATGGGGRASVTVMQLLTHRAGLAPDDPMELYAGTPAEIFARKYRQPLEQEPGTRFVYSDVGFEVLGELVRAVSGEPLDRYAARVVFAPLGMVDTEFRPQQDGIGHGRIPVERIAPTETRNGAMMRGTVHDPRAFALGGVAGHAGLFSTADDLARYAAAILSGGGGVLSPAGVAAMTVPRPFGDHDLRAIGWDLDTGYSSNRGALFPVGSFGHTGWTGTSLWIDPLTGVYVVVLASRVHPDGSGNVVPLRSRLASVAAAAVRDLTADAFRRATEPYLPLLALPPAPEHRPGPAAAAAPAPKFDVRTGIDVLESNGFAEVAGRKVALLTNRTGLTRDGRPTIAVLRSEKARAAGVSLVRLFSPEHGLCAEKDEAVGDTTERETALPVVSLYGDKLRPAPGDLAGLDAVVVDLQDAGARFYTYLTTVGWLMEEAAKAKVSVVVLDRPDPIGGVLVEGPPADADKLSFTAVHTLPVRTGMTIGEVARMVAAERKLPVELKVVALEGWRRELYFDETGLPWIAPSPNLRTPNQAVLYPGVALLETTNVSVGRGTDTPFELVGAPWLDGARLARTLSLRSLPGVRFAPVTFTPAASMHVGQACRGVRISVVDRAAVRPVALGLEIAAALRDLHPREWDRRQFGQLLASGAALARFEKGDTAAQVESVWAASLMEFERRRAAFLLYRD